MSGIVMFEGGKKRKVWIASASHCDGGVIGEMRLRGKKGGKSDEQSDAGRRVLRCVAGVYSVLL